MSLDTQLLGLMADLLTGQMWAQADPAKRGARPRPVLGDLMGTQADDRRSGMTPEQMYARLQALSHPQEVNDGD